MFMDATKLSSLVVSDEVKSHEPPASGEGDCEVQQSEQEVGATSAVTRKGSSP